MTLGSRTGDPFDRTPYQEMTNEDIVTGQQNLSMCLVKHLVKRGDRQGLEILQGFTNLWIEWEIRMLDAETIKHMIEHTES